MLLAIMRTTPRMKVFILGVKFCIQKSTLKIYQMVIKLGISKPTRGNKITREIDNQVYHLNNNVII
jgi:hypothetical protein